MAAGGQLSKRGHTVVVRCTDGVNSCTQTFNIAVNAVIGPNIFIGAGMVAAHGALGYDTLEAWATIFSRRDLIAGLNIQVTRHPFPGHTQSVQACLCGGS